MLGPDLGPASTAIRERYERDLGMFEKQYGMDSVTFHQRFEAGDLGNAVGFFAWAGLYELRQDLLEKLRRIETVW